MHIPLTDTTHTNLYNMLSYDFIQLKGFDSMGGLELLCCRDRLREDLLSLWVPFDNGDYGNY